MSSRQRRRADFGAALRSEANHERSSARSGLPPAPKQQQIDAEREPDSDASPDAVPRQVLPRRVAVSGQVPKLFRDPRREGECRAGHRPLPGALQNQGRSGVATSREPGRHAEVQRLVGAEEVVCLGVSSVYRAREARRECEDAER